MELTTTFPYKGSTLYGLSQNLNEYHSDCLVYIHKPGGGPVKLSSLSLISDSFVVHSWGSGPSYLPANLLVFPPFYFTKFPTIRFFNLLMIEPISELLRTLLRSKMTLLPVTDMITKTILFTVLKWVQKTF